jgi:DNA phosphorothioation-dependent restriction protein DptF
MNSLESKFTNEMISIYNKAKKELGYNATRLLHLISSSDGVKAAKNLVSKSGTSEGFEVLWESGRLDLSVEALVIKVEFRELFTVDEINICKSRLKAANFQIEELEEKENERTIIDNINEKKAKENNHKYFVKKSIKVEYPKRKLLQSENGFNCGLLFELKKLKESSKEAVEGIEKFSEFKEYMHVMRKVENELEDKLQKIKLNNISKQLVLVCGSVGDGKSHIISQLKHKGLLENFTIYNDATESDDPGKTYIEKLDELFTPFSDENINSVGMHKVIVAINLGTLSNFIEFEKIKEKYSIFYDFVNRNKIIEDEIVEVFQNDYIDYINFSDYSLYELQEIKPKSNFMTQLLKKISNKFDENPFYYHYKKCNKCQFSTQCPLKINYEFIQQDKIMESIIDLVIEAIIKYKIIVSVRSLLDFYYGILVPQELERLLEQNTMDKFGKSIYRENVYWKMLLPNILFEHKNRTPLYTGLSYVDPLNERAESVDEFIVEINVLNDKSKKIAERFGFGEFLILNKYMDDLYLKEISSKNISFVVKTYLRFAQMINHEIIPYNTVYNNYVKYLFYSNSSSLSNMKPLYETVIGAIYKWNGNDNESNWINLDSSSISKDYAISQELKIIPVLKPSISDSVKETIYKFESEIKILLKSSKANTDVIYFMIDYDLYDLLVKINYGYRLNNLDRENYIAFIDNLEKLLDLGDKNEVVKITHKTTNNLEKYELKKDMFGGYSFDRAY